MAQKLPTFEQLIEFIQTRDYYTDEYKKEAITSLRRLMGPQSSSIAPKRVSKRLSAISYTQTELNG